MPIQNLRFSYAVCGGIGAFIGSSIVHNYYMPDTETVVSYQDYLNNTVKCPIRRYDPVFLEKMRQDMQAAIERQNEKVANMKLVDEGKVRLTHLMPEVLQEQIYETKAKMTGSGVASETRAQVEEFVSKVTEDRDRGGKT